MIASPMNIWVLILLIALGTFLIRFSFLGIVGNRPLPPFLIRLLRYTPVAVLPAMVAPQVLWPAATGGETDALRLLAAFAALAMAVTTRKVVPSIVVGSVVLLVGLQISAMV